MGDEWVPTKVADLKPGDEVADFGGPLLSIEPAFLWATATRAGYMHTDHDPVLVRTLPEVTVRQPIGSSHWYVYCCNEYIASVRSKRHAECYAEKLRNDPTLRAEALGQ